MSTPYTIRSIVYDFFERRDSSERIFRELGHVGFPLYSDCHSQPTVPASTQNFSDRPGAPGRRPDERYETWGTACELEVPLKVHWQDPCRLM